jgi:hypothetical protein
MSDPTRWIYPQPPPAEATSAAQLEHLLATRPSVKVEIDLDRYRIALEDSAGVSSEVAQEAEAERIARARRAGVTPS